MATWTTIPDSLVEPDKPIRSLEALALRDNPIAIAEGAAGAPKIDPLAAFAHNGSAGAVGTYAWARRFTNTDVAFGSTVAGSDLRATSSLWAQDATMGAYSLAPTGTTLSGTWRSMGMYDATVSSGGGSLGYGATLWLRIA